MGRNAYLILISATTSTNRFNSQIISSTVQKKRSILKGIFDCNSCVYCIGRGKYLAGFGNFSTYTSSLSIRRFWGKGGKREAKNLPPPPSPLGRPDTQATYTNGYNHLNMQVVILPKQQSTLNNYFSGQIFLNLYYNKYRLLLATRRTYFVGGVGCEGEVGRDGNASDLQFIMEVPVLSPTLNTRNTCK